VGQTAVVRVAQAAIAAFGPAPDLAHTALIYLIAAIGLTRIGPTAGQAIAAVLTFRLLTFWIPIVPGLVAHREDDELVF
jgi:hypothetical protein